MVEAKAIFQENRQLKADAPASRARARRPIAIGRIVGSSFNSPRRFAILSVGTSDGVRIGMPVRSADGLVGRIIDAGALASRVLLVSDRANIVPARLLRNGIPVISQGRGDGTIDVRPLEVGRNPFKRGDIIITSGTGGLYPPLVPIARVVKLDDDGAVALPLADPVDDQLRDRRAAVRAGRDRRRDADQPRRRRPDGPRRARPRRERIGQGPAPFATLRPGGDRWSPRRCCPRCRSCRPAAGIRTSATSC